MDAREQRGLVIAAVSKLRKKGAAWLVPSQSGKPAYTVVPDDVSPHCTCPDHEAGFKCKHIFAVEYTVKRESTPDGETVVSTLTVTETIKRPTYRQDWPAYNAAQMNEKDKFQTLLHDLCKGVEEPPQEKGRPRLPLADQVFAAVFKIYSTFSGRRFMSDLRAANEKGHVSTVPHYNSIFRCLESESLTPLLRRLIAQSALPLKSVEVDFASDSTSFATTRFVKWYDTKYGQPKNRHTWVKLQMMCGVKTNVVTSAEAINHDGADGPYLPAQVKETAQNFKIREVSADKAFLSQENFETVAAVGGTAYIPFKSNSTGAVGGLFQKMFHYFSFRREEFMTHYHKRSNIESTVSMMKAKFRDSVRSKTDAAMVNEVLCKVLCHNLCCLIQEMYELKIEPVFWQEPTAKPPVQENPASPETGLCPSLVALV